MTENLKKECANFYDTIFKFDRILWDKSSNSDDKKESLKNIYIYCNDLFTELCKIPETKERNDNICKILNTMEHYENSCTWGDTWELIENEIENEEKMENEEMKKDKQIHFRVSNEEMDSIKKLASDYGVSVTDYIKSCMVFGGFEKDMAVQPFKRQNNVFCESLEELKQREQKILEEYEILYREYGSDYCEPDYKFIQREQEELEQYIEQEEMDSFEFEIQEFENNFKKRVESGELTYGEVRFLQESLDRCKEYYENEIDKCILYEKELSEIY